MVCIVDAPDNNLNIQIGSTGTVCEAVTDTDGYQYIISVAWDEYVHGHSCNRNCESGHGWNVSVDQIEHLYDSANDFECATDAELELLLGIDESLKKFKEEAIIWEVSMKGE